MKKLLLVTAISSALTLAGCGSGDEAPTSETVDYQVNATRVVFDPSNGAISVPSNILLSGSVDGTLNIPVADPSDNANPQVALNGLDGWGTHSTLTFDFSLPDDANGNPVAVDANSLEAPGSIRIFETIMGGTAVNEACAAASPAATCAVVAELTYGVDFIVKATGPAGVAVIPLKPLKAKTGYAAVLTSNITDELGRSVWPSQTYGLMQRNADTDPVSADASAVGLQRLINSHENALAAFGVDKEEIIYVSSFTTQSVNDAFGAIKALYAQQFSQGAGPALMAQPTGMSVGDILVASGRLDANPQDPAYLAAISASVYQAQVTLPYYSPVPTAEDPQAPLNGRWQAMCDSPASILGAIGAGALPAAAVDPAGLQDPTRLLPPYNCYDFPGVDEERHITKYNPIPAATTQMDIPAVVTVPDVAKANMLRAAQGLDPLVEPANGWPVVIFQHGITGEKTNVFGIAGTLAAMGFATVAIDHPLHGDRGFGPINATTGSATAYMNLASLLTARDNLRQSIADLLGLRVSLNAAMGAPLNGQNVYFLGHSLGAIAGTGFTAMTNAPLSGQLAPASALFKVNASSLMAPGASVANFLLASPSFGPVIKGQLLYAANADFAQAVNNAAQQAGVSPTSPAFQGLLVQVYQQFWAGLSAAEQASINGVFEQFAFAAQSVIDSADPINYAAQVTATESPIHLIEVVGNGADFLADQVIPNTVAGKPLAGTEALISALQLESITQTTASVDGSKVSGAVRFTEGSHSSIVDPSASAAATMEMQMQAAGWFSTNATAIPVTNTAVIKQ
ncbi:alpha/beta hydrolase [Pseudidiomarina sediminum]|uniref:Alpha/beta hydrolase n=1 Tax=Pseudidiomarina sediminum TaxID=431675 RepID=A0A432Z8Y8_9GAMM|nr:VolA/Pla-1 family phospholipase [Pseudidiomarina sediminum]MBY6063530.1 alpha/beta hydrolase [Pseudidiomarina sediminum]RUO74358.1 alpha/beta hydrolase [Pseudidiomarina sediminum]